MSRRIEVKIRADASEFNRQLARAQAIVSGKPLWWIRLTWWLEAKWRRL